MESCNLFSVFNVFRYRDSSNSASPIVCSAIEFGDSLFLIMSIDLSLLCCQVSSLLLPLLFSRFFVGVGIAHAQLFVQQLNLEIVYFLIMSIDLSLLCCRVSSLLLPLLFSRFVVGVGIAHAQLFVHQLNLEIGFFK